MLWDWQVFDLDGWIVPKGTKNVDEVLKYLKFATDTQRLADQAKYISYGPARKSSAPLVGKHATLGIDMKPHMPTTPGQRQNHACSITTSGGPTTATISTSSSRPGSPRSNGRELTD